jgi:DNA-binding transcriptional regulator YdaS (Cro superfamily)
MSLGTKTNHLTKEPTSKRWKRHSLYVGLQSRIARTLGVSSAAVCQVMSGKKTSARISKAIDREIARIEREIERDRRQAA